MSAIQPTGNPTEHPHRGGKSKPAKAHSFCACGRPPVVRDANGMPRWNLCSACLQRVVAARNERLLEERNPSDRSRDRGRDHYETDWDWE